MRVGVGVGERTTRRRRGKMKKKRRRNEEGETRRGSRTPRGEKENRQTDRQRDRGTNGPLLTNLLVSAVR
jgi:hypothetical protein